MNAASQSSFEQLRVTPAQQLIERLAEHGVCALRDDTQALRSLILDAGLDYTIYGRAPNRRCETYAQAFERLLREPLEAKTRKGKVNAQSRPT
jgi:hypothetical protein